ncbi:MAG TPA: YbaL family putative K(+) efflux transporter [Micropepsaceae bacterium]|nr:YbaL family putative K(+) efflux transporter [Micropepsaceae bacterium]
MTQAPLISMLVIGLGLAFVFATLANRLKLSPIAGYLLAGVAVGPFTPGFIGDPTIALQLADVGVILLMFGVGLHFSLHDLMALKKAVIPSVFAQVAISASLGAAVAWAIGLPLGGAVVFGSALSVASTVVLLRSLQNRRLLDTERGRLAIGWLIVQDFVTVVLLVLIPAFAQLLKAQETGAAFDGAQLFETLALTFGKLAAFIGIMLVVGRRAIPALLHYVAHTGSRELFRLAVLSVALGVAFLAAELFGVSFALGAFFAGMILSESQLSARAAEESLPLRDAFAVLFFVSIGMLFNPMVLVNDTAALGASVLVVIVGNGVIAFALTRLLGYSVETALLIGVGLAQIGEFSFILADLGIGLDLLTARGRDLILGSSIIAILVNPFLAALASRIHPAHPPGKPVQDDAPPELHPTALTHHIVLVGYGRVGNLVGRALRDRNETFLVIEDSDKLVGSLHEAGIEVIPGNAVQPRVLDAANVKAARLLFIAIPNGFEAGQIVEQARARNPMLQIVARAHSNDEVEYLLKLSANAVIMGEREIARGMIEHAFGASDPAASAAGPLASAPAPL